MLLSQIINELRAGAPRFGGRVFGAAEFAAVPEAGHAPVASAYVMPLDDRAGDNTSSTGIYQQNRDAFAVVVSVDNTADELGSVATADQVHVVRAELLAVLAGLRVSADYGPIEYEGGMLLKMNRARLFYRFEFGADWELHASVGTTDATRQGRDLAALSPLAGIDIALDAIAPTTPPAPDGVIDARLSIDLPPPT